MSDHSRSQIHGATWAAELAADIQAEGLIHLRNCRDEVEENARQPDISATMPDGQPIAIEVAFPHFCDQDCDQEKIEWMSARNLTTLDIEIFIPQSTSASDVVAILKVRLPGTAANSRWVHHAGEARVLTAYGTSWLCQSP
ncbi:MAG: hypothetical protein JNK06_12255 [Candidatus Accumulibacter phosphatis]|uniref:hypothetical protein n=1 Tax=Candidatus Accumulibacter phosphatis TaxID=327160 RepID=UPI001A393D3E|nr:hypothetical protein [Candidatus Accumulibacter phosphatis]